MKTLVIQDQIIINIVEGEVDLEPSESTLVLVDSSYRADIGWAWDGEIAIEPPPTPTAVDPVPNWLGFNTAFLSNKNWNLIAPLFSSPDLRTGIAAPAAMGDSNALQYAIGMGLTDLISQDIPLDPAVLAEWQAIADVNNIPINFEVTNG